MSTITLKLAEGRRVRHPETKMLLDNRMITVEKSGYWAKRLLDGDVVLVDDGDKNTPEAPKAGKAENDKGAK